MKKLFEYVCITRHRPYSYEETKKKVSETSITGNKVTQDQDDTNKEERVGSSIEGKKRHQYV